MSNIDIQNMKNDLDRKIYKIFGMSLKNYVGTYDFIVRQTISYAKKSNGQDAGKLITVISNPEGNYIDYVKGHKSDINHPRFGKRCVFKKGNIVITGKGTNPSSVLTNLKIEAVCKITINILIIGLIMYLIFYVINYFL